MFHLVHLELVVSEDVGEEVRGHLTPETRNCGVNITMSLATIILFSESS